MLKKHDCLKLVLLLLFAFTVAACSSGDSVHDDHSDHAHEGDAAGQDETDEGAGESASTFTQMSDDGNFHLTLESESEMLMINELHSWILTVQSADMSTAIEDATITFDGGMPEHNHGFATEPEVMGHIGDGKYRIEGVQFQMGGNWEMDIEIEAGGESDTANFKVVVPQ